MVFAFVFVVVFHVHVQLGILSRTLFLLFITGQVLKWARHSNLSGGLSPSKADGWNLKNQSVARHPREKTHSSILILTIREVEERGVRSAALRELLRSVKDQLEERGVVMIVTHRVSNLEKCKPENCATRESTEIRRR